MTKREITTPACRQAGLELQKTRDCRAHLPAGRQVAGLLAVTEFY